MSNEKRSRTIPLEVQHIRDALRREFGDLIDMSDYEGRPEQIDQAFFSRALSAKASRILTDCSSEEAAAGVIDGRDDFGIDAIAFSSSGSELWLIQAKWSERGRAGFDTNAARSLVDGLKKLDSREFERFNDRLQLLADRVHGVLRLPTCKVHLVAAVLGDGLLSSHCADLLSDAAKDFGGYGRTVQYRALGQAQFHRAVRDDLTPEPITLSDTMSNGWYSRETPFQAYDGLVCVQDLAGWYTEHGERLYDRNVRGSLGLTSVNQTLVDSLIDDPEGFWYRHNGITVQCRAIETEFFAQRGPSKPLRLTLHDASVVNGAQTVTSAHRAFEQVGNDALVDGYVTVRIISVDGAPDGFAKEITQATNTQNRMEKRDFVAIDQIQSAISEDFRLTFDKEYIFKRGEMDPAPLSGCSILEAATALACANSNPSLAVRVSGSTEALWETGPRGAYTRIFGNQPGAVEIWRSVQLMRAARDKLQEMRPKLSGRPASVAQSATLLTVHILFQLIGKDRMDEPDAEWEATLDRIPADVERVLAQLIRLTDDLFGPGSYVTSTFANEQRCQQLVSNALHNLTGSGDAPATEFKFFEPPRGRRRPNTVPLLLDHDRIAEGTRLRYVPSQAEFRAIGTWLEADTRRTAATWVRDRRAPLLWEADGERYSPSGLVNEIWRIADWRDAWSAVQGPKQWEVPGEGTLADIAEQLWLKVQAAE